MIRWVDGSHRLWSDTWCTKFVIRPSEDDQERFYIEMPYGEFRPRLTTYNKVVNYSSLLVCSSKHDLHQYQTEWKIKMAKCEQK